MDKKFGKYFFKERRGGGRGGGGKEGERKERGKRKKEGRSVRETSSLPHLKNLEFLGPCIIYLIILSLPLHPTQLNPVVILIGSCGYNVDN